MLIGYGMPAVTNIALAGGTWLTDGGWLPLVDGRPTRAARIQRAGSVTLTVSLASAIVPGVIALLGLNVPAGIAVSAAGASGVTHALPDGSIAAYLLPSGSAAVSSVAITIAGGGMLQIGEVVVMRATSARITNDWGVTRVANQERSRSRGGAVGTSEGPSYRRLRVALSLASNAAAHGGGLDGGMDWDRLDVALANDQRCIAIPRRLQAGVLHPPTLHRHALYGIAADLGESAHVRGPWHTKTLVFEEVPP